jgi:DNA-binding GntR family transcriptional regulator
MSADIISINPSPRTALHEQVALRLREMLVESRIAPGAKLNERELSEVLNVSRTPLREAIKMLAAEGLVELLPNRGAIAVELSPADVLNTFEVMAGLEAQSGELAAERITDAEMAEIQAMHYEMLAAYTRRDLPASQCAAASPAFSLQPRRRKMGRRHERTRTNDRRLDATRPSRHARRAAQPLEPQARRRDGAIVSAAAKP